ncbi:MAG: hypothetical protein AAF939_10630, partial [Planctomycetota bacterium]
SDEVVAKAKRYAADWFEKNDSNRDKLLTAAELPIVSRWLMGRADFNNDSKVDPNELEVYARKQFQRREDRQR